MMVAVAFGGFFGSILRYAIGQYVTKRFAGTWIVNVLGSMLLAFLFHEHEQGNITDQIWSFAGIGFCGAFTTFSTFSNDVLQLMIEKHYKKALFYIASSVFVSIASAAFILYFLN
ncbi:fluoride efflux transporter FluC [Oceanobacillus kapialis]|uniref:Fluoride-specific ion channel FluC n=1 Tax=Oceanobacillus kapialis TaxID=481353 RepID=A0ABW5Q0J3_9BACI